MLNNFNNTLIILYIFADAASEPEASEQVSSSNLTDQNASLLTDQNA